MTNSSIARPGPLAAIVAFGKPSGPELSQASWFKAEDIVAVKAAAGPLKFSVIELQTEADKGLAIGVHEGVLKGSGRMIIGSVTHEVYRRIEERARKATSGDPASALKPREAASGGVKTSGGAKASSTTANAGPDSAGAASLPAVDPRPGASTALAAAPSAPIDPPSLTAPWDSLRVGGTVLAGYWNEKGELEGFWPAVITRAEKSELVLKWRDTPEYALGNVERKYIAILHPDFVAAGKWAGEPIQSINDQLGRPSGRPLHSRRSLQRRSETHSPHHHETTP
jgi:hypothetical protein